MTGHIPPYIFVPSLGAFPRFVKESGIAALKADGCVGFVVRVGRFPGTAIVERLRDPARSDEWALERAEHHHQLAQKGAAPESSNAA